MLLLIVVGLTGTSFCPWVAGILPISHASIGTPGPVAVRPQSWTSAQASYPWWLLQVAQKGSPHWLHTVRRFEHGSCAVQPQSSFRLGVRVWGTQQLPMCWSHSPSMSIYSIMYFNYTSNMSWCLFGPIGFKRRSHPVALVSCACLFSGREMDRDRGGTGPKFLDREHPGPILDDFCSYRKRGQRISLVLLPFGAGSGYRARKLIEPESFLADAFFQGPQRASVTKGASNDKAPQGASKSKAQWILKITRPLVPDAWVRAFRAEASAGTQRIT